MFEPIRLGFGYLLDWLYQFTNNYGLALILFAIIVRLVLIPVNAKSKKSMMKMSRLQPKIQAIKDKYPNDQQKQNEAVQQLQKEEGASMGCGGCLWSFVPLLILIPLFEVIREPLQYLLHLDEATALRIVEIVKAEMPSLFTGTAGTSYAQVLAAPYIPQFAEQILAEFPNIDPRVLEGVNFNFLGIDLGIIPNWRVWTWTAFSWPAIGGVLIPLLSGGSQMLQMWLSQRSNDSLVTDKNGMEDKETAKQSQSAQQSKMMMWMMPLMSLLIGFTVPTALSLYWFVGGLVSMIENHFMTKHYRKVYDAEDAQRLERYKEQQAAEEEKERIRAEKRAANPDGITENTSKKKQQKKQKAEQEAARAAAKREYDAAKGIVEEEPQEEVMSGIPERPYCKGRAYDPDRYNHTEEE